LAFPIIDTMEIFYSHTKYVTPTLVRLCFVPNQITHVDKQLRGNGFSSATASLKPSRNKVNIILAPNRQFVIDKKNEFGHRQGDIRYKYFYGKSEDTSVQDADVLFFVADSFFLMHQQVRTLNVDLFFIDEFHTVERASSYRNPLVNLMEKIQAIIETDGVSFVTVTATPNVFSKVDIRIENSIKNPFDIKYSKDRNLAVKRIKNDIKNGIPVVIGTQCKDTIFAIMKGVKIPINNMMGKKLTSTLAEYISLEHDPNSLITFCSSASYDGISIHYEKITDILPKAYMFEKRSVHRNHQNLSQASIYQFFHRNRNGYQYYELCRQEIAEENRSILSLKAIEYFINRDDISTENKQKTKYKDFHPFVIFSQRKLPGINGRFFNIEINDVAIRMLKEHILFDSNFNDFVDGKLGTLLHDPIESPTFEYGKIIEFWNNRNVTFTQIDVGSIEKNVPRAKTRTTTKKKMLLANKEIIEKLDLFGADFKPYIFKMGLKFKLKDYHDHLVKYLRKKHYDGSEHTEREDIALKLLDFNDSKEFFMLCKSIWQEYARISKLKYGRRGSAKWIAEFKKEVYWYVAQWILAFSQNRISVPKKVRGWRDYNLATQRKTECVQMIAKRFNIDVLSLDIPSAFPRILFNGVGLPLPGNLYGKDKENKIAINKFLNDFKFRSYRKDSFKKQKSDAKARMIKFGFPDKVITMLLQRFFNTKHRGDLFTMLSSYEYEIIDETINELSHLDNDGIVSRHDEILVFNNRSNLMFLNTKIFNGFDGYFDVVEDVNMKALHPHLETNRIAKIVAEETEKISVVFDEIPVAPMQETDFDEDWCEPFDDDYSYSDIA